MRRITRIFACLLLLVLVLPSVALAATKVTYVQKYDEDGYSEGLSFSTSTITLKVGATLTVKPAAGTSKKGVKFASNNKKVAKVTSAGKITAVAPGVTAIFITGDNASDRGLIVTVKGKKSKDPTPINSSDRKFYVGKKRYSMSTSLTSLKKTVKSGKTQKYSDKYELYTDETRRKEKTFKYQTYSVKKSGKSLHYSGYETIFEYLVSGGDQRLIGIYASGKSAFKTARGIKIGDKLSKVKSTYGTPSYPAWKGKKGSKTYTCYSYFNYDYSLANFFDPDMVSVDFVVDSKNKVVAIYQNTVGYGDHMASMAFFY